LPVGNIVTAKREWTLVSGGYDYRFGGLSVKVESPMGDQAVFVLPIPDLIRKSIIPAHELRALIKEAEEPLSDLPDHETARRQTIIDTDLAGKTVLDVGGYDGIMAKLALDNGAAKAICLDNHQYDHYGWAEKRYPGVEYVQGDFMDYRRGEFGGHENYLFGPPESGVALPCPDVTIFYNVLYHLKNPWRALEHLRSFTREQMLLQTLFRYHDGPWIYLYEPRECNPTDESVFWGPSIPALERLLTQTGWKHEKMGQSFDRVVYRCWPTGEVQQRQSRW